LNLLRKVRQIPGIRKVFICSGIRYDMVMEDQRHGEEYIRVLAEHHTSGQLKVAPEHTDEQVLRLMGKPVIDSLLEFQKKFEFYSRRSGKKQFLTYYLIAAYPGCGEREMKNLQRFMSSKFHVLPEQVQIFTPTPSTYASVMYYTQKDPFSGESVFVEKNIAGKNRQKEMITCKQEKDKRRDLNRSVGYAKYQKRSGSHD